MATLYVRSYPGSKGDESKELTNFLDFLYDMARAAGINPVTNNSWLDRIATALHDVSVEAMTRREVFWSLLVQSAISVIVIVFVVILLLLKIVSAEAGLPILAAFGGAAIGRTIESGRSSALRPRTETTSPTTPTEGR